MRTCDASGRIRHRGGVHAVEFNLKKYINKTQYALLSFSSFLDSGVCLLVAIWALGPPTRLPIRPLLALFSAADNKSVKCDPVRPFLVTLGWGGSDLALYGRAGHASTVVTRPHRRRRRRPFVDTTRFILFFTVIIFLLGGGCRSEGMILFVLCCLPSKG